MPITIPILLVLSVTLAILCLKLKNINAALISAVFSFPAIFYLAGTPVYSGIIIVVPLMQFGSAYFIYKDNMKMAFIMQIPIFLVVLWTVGLYFF